MRRRFRAALRCTWVGMLLAAACSTTPTTTANVPTPVGVRSTLGKVTPSPAPMLPVFTTPTPGPLSTVGPTATPTAGASVTPGATKSATVNPSATSSATVQPSATPTATPTPLPTATPVPTPTPLTTTTINLRAADGSAVVLGDPAGMAADASGHIFLADSGTNLIHRFDANGNDVIIAGSGQSGAANGLGAAATFSAPSSLALDTSGNMYVADNNNCLIRKIDASGNVTTYAGGLANQDGTFVGFVDGAAIGGSKFGGPQGLAIDNSGATPVLYVADSGNNAIRKIATTGGVLTVSTLVGNSAGGAGGNLDGPAASATLSAPTGVLLDQPHQLLYILDSGNSRVRVLNLGTSTVTTLAGHASGYHDDIGTAALFSLGARADLAFDASGDLFLPDTINNVIRHIAITTSTVSTTAGRPNVAPGSVDGPPTTAEFNFPTNVLFTGGVLYVSDSHNKTIRELK